MTRSQRNITPGKGGISTFLDCKYYRNPDECWKCVYVGYADGTESDYPTWCKIYAETGNCPEGYAR